MDPSNLLPFLPHGVAGLAIIGGIYWMQRHEKRDDKRFQYMADHMDKLVSKIDASIADTHKGRERILELLLEMKNDHR